MNDTIHIHTRIDSETLTLPELRPFVGKSVEITVREEALQEEPLRDQLPAPKRPNVELLEQLAKEIDFSEEAENAFWELRRISKI
jgi:hypothetical protein